MFLFYSPWKPQKSRILTHLDLIQRGTEYLSVFSPNAEKYGFSDVFTGYRNGTLA